MTEHPTAQWDLQQKLLEIHERLTRSKSHEMYDAPKLVTPTEVSEMTALPTSTLRALRESGGGPRFLRFGKRAVYRTKDVMDWAESNLAPLLYARAGRRLTAQRSNRSTIAGETSVVDSAHRRSTRGPDDKTST